MNGKYHRGWVAPRDDGSFTFIAVPWHPRSHEHLQLASFKDGQHRPGDVISAKQLTLDVEQPALGEGGKA